MRVSLAASRLRLSILIASVAALVIAALLIVVGLTANGGNGRAPGLAATPTATAIETPSPEPTPTDYPTLPPRPPVTHPDTVIPEGFEEWYLQEVVWVPCDAVSGGPRFECATISAPLSWRDADAGSIELAVNRRSATGSRQGSVLINPGGPGSSGIEYLMSAANTFGERLRDAFDIVGFDPRGVGQSTPIRCFDDAEKDAAISRDFSTDDAGLAEMAASSQAWGEACYAASGALLGNVDTQSAARDMDLIRALLGEERLDFLGFSYGTQLGATYAMLFPQHVGRFVLDGAVDVTLTSEESSLNQAQGFEQALRSYVIDCQGGANCPLTGTVEEGMEQVRELLETAFTDPFPTSSGRRVTETLAFYGIAVTLYSEDSWMFLTMALQEAILMGTADTLLLLADFYFDRNEDGTFSSNMIEAFLAVRCLDDRANDDLAVMRQWAARIEEAAPTMGAFFGFGGLSCSGWPFDPVPPLTWGPVDTEQPIVVIGTTGDPATPYESAHALVATLGNAVMVTFDGEGHTAYGRSNDCILNAVDSFFVDGIAPANGLVC